MGQLQQNNRFAGGPAGVVPHRSIFAGLPHITALSGTDLTTFFYLHQFLYHNEKTMPVIQPVVIF